MRRSALTPMRRAFRTPSPIQRRRGSPPERRGASAPSSCDRRPCRIRLGSPSSRDGLRACPCPTVRSNCHVVCHGLREDEPLVLDDVQVCSREPHAHGPCGVCISIHTRRVPPSRTSNSATGMEAPSRPVPLLEPLRDGPQSPDDIDRCRECVRSLSRPGGDLASLPPSFRCCWSSMMHSSIRSNRASQTGRYRSAQVETSSSGVASSEHGRNWARWVRTIKPARSRTLMCFESRGGSGQRLGQLVDGRLSSCQSRHNCSTSRVRRAANVSSSLVSSSTAVDMLPSGTFHMS